MTWNEDPGPQVFERELWRMAVTSPGASSRPGRCWPAPVWPEQLATRQGDVALRLHRRAAPPVPGHLPAAQPQHPAAPACAGRGGQPARPGGVRRRRGDREAVGRATSARGRRSAPVEKQIGRRDQAARRLWHLAEYSREVHEEYAVQRWPETKRLLGRWSTPPARRTREARRLVQAARKQDRRLSAALLAAALAHPRGSAGAGRRAHADGAQAERPGPRAAAQLPEGQAQAWRTLPQAQGRRLEGGRRGHGGAGQRPGGAGRRGGSRVPDAEGPPGRRDPRRRGLHERGLHQGVGDPADGRRTRRGPDRDSRWTSA